MCVSVSTHTSMVMWGLEDNLGALSSSSLFEAICELRLTDLEIVVSSYSRSPQKNWDYRHVVLYLPCVGSENSKSDPHTWRASV